MLEREENTLETARLLKQELLGQLQPTAFAASATNFVQGVKAAYIGRLQNVVGIGYGVKITEGKVIPDETCVHVYVRKKFPLNSLQAKRIPSFVNGIPTDVIEVGDVRASAVTTSYIPTTECGVSAAHFAVTAGTLGCLVKHSKTGIEYMLSCNHVFANSNLASLNDDILQASPQDFGPAGNPLGKLVDFEAIDFTLGQANHIDAAIASVCNPKRSVVPSIMAFGRLTLPPNTTASAPSEVLKYGRTTGPTEGQVIDISADISVGYGPNSADFEDQIAIHDGPSVPFAADGDSGSIIFEKKTKRPIGLLFAVGKGLCYANPIDEVLKRFSVDIL